jgi:hypothetical protein
MLCISGKKNGHRNIETLKLIYYHGNKNRPAWGGTAIKKTYRFS